ncbi:hypothetical protein DFJ73DRAFT_819226 [Zopfochytrium polystomum]|nr:hypothetical protein DFJ73DRAFT_819226 [Zopfochytrium polystomum]
MRMRMRMRRAAGVAVAWIAIRADIVRRRGRRRRRPPAPGGHRHRCKEIVGTRPTPQLSPRWRIYAHPNQTVAAIECCFVPSKGKRKHKEPSERAQTVRRAHRGDGWLPLREQRTEAQNNTSPTLTGLGADKRTRCTRSSGPHAVQCGV